MVCHPPVRAESFDKLRTNGDYTAGDASIYCGTITKKLTQIGDMTQPPNFLFLITDQHRWDYLGCNGHKLLKTPHLDAIAAQGTNFSRFQVASPVCMPNRASLLTGRLPSTHGLRYNGNPLPINTVTFVDVLREGGYRTAAIGKSHLQAFTSVPAYERVNPATIGPIQEARWLDGNPYDLERPETYAGTERFQFTEPFYGFEHVDMVLNHGQLAGGHYLQWLRQQSVDIEAIRDRSNQLPHDYTCPQAYRTPVPEELYHTTYIRDRAVDYLNSQKNAESPFFSFVSFPDPHHPFNPPGKYWEMYDPEDFEVPLPYEAHQNPTPPMQKVLELYQQGATPATPQTVFIANKRQIQEAMALSCGMISMIDDAVGDIVQTLKDNGQYDNTVIIFTSDHGDYLGDFSLMLKGALPFKSITNVPFLWSDPETRKARQSNALGSTLDIAPSIIARAGLKPFWGIQGRDLADCLKGGDELRDACLIEYHDGLARIGFDEPAMVRSLVTDDFRLTLYKGLPWGELYDLRNDPDETHNRWDDPGFADVKAELTNRLAHEMIDSMDRSPRATYMA